MNFEHKNEQNDTLGSGQGANPQSDPAQQDTQQQPETGFQMADHQAQDERPQADPFRQSEMNQPAHPAYTTYQEWMHQEDKRTDRQARREKRKAHKGSRKPLLVIGSVAAACVLLAGGIAIGSVLSGGGAQDPAVAAVNDANLPTVNISSPAGTESTASAGLSGEEIYQKVAPSVVSVQAVNISTGSGGTGSGVIMSADGYIITNNHVIVDEQTGDPLDKITVYLSDGTTFPAAVIGRDAQTDLAVIKVDPAGTTLSPAEFGDSNDLNPGEEVYAIGSPGGLDLASTITGGHISALNRDITIDDRVMSLIQTDAAINPGNSGGALINKYGQVIGITSAKMGVGSYEGLGFAIPMDTAKPIVDELIQNGYIAGRPQIGISGLNISEQQSAAYGIPQGVRVMAVDSRSNAAKAGIQINDIIIEVNGTIVTDMDGVNEAKEGMKAGDKITLKLYRMSTGKPVTVTFPLNDQHDLEGQDPAEQQQQQQMPDESYYQNPFSFFFGW